MFQLSPTTTILYTKHGLASTSSREVPRSQHLSSDQGNHDLEVQIKFLATIGGAHLNLQERGFISLCDQFWDATLLGIDSQAGILLRFVTRPTQENDSLVINRGQNFGQQ